MFFVLFRGSYCKEDRVGGDFFVVWIGVDNWCFLIEFSGSNKGEGLCLMSHIHAGDLSACITIVYLLCHSGPCHYVCLLAIRIKNIYACASVNNNISPYSMGLIPESCIPLSLQGPAIMWAYKARRSCRSGGSRTDSIERSRTSQVLA